jgi:hypothetical protein
MTARRSYVPGVTDETTLLAVTQTGETAAEVPIRSLSAEDLQAAWRAR